MYTRFVTSFELCLTTLSFSCSFHSSRRQKEKNDRDAIERTLPLDLMEYAKERNIVSVLDNEDVCKRLYPFVPEMFCSPEGLRKIVSIVELW